MPESMVRGKVTREILSRACMVEPLESRRLLASTMFTVADALNMTSASNATFAEGITPAAANPSVASSNPVNGATNIPRYQAITLSLSITNPGHGVDPATLTLDTVKINRTSDGQFVNANLNPDGAGTSITIQPTALLSAHTTYTVKVTTGLKDTTGASFTAFQMTFTTGEQVPAQDTNIEFSQTDQNTSLNRRYASLAWGPDNKLYAGTLDGQILRFSVGADGTLGSPEVFNTVNTKNGQNRFIIGMEFDPTSTADNLILWVTHSQGVLENASDFTGKLSRLKGPTLSQYTDFVINLPRSVRDHLSNQLHFGPDGALYFSQPSMNAMGAPDTAWVRAEHPLSGAVLRVDIRNINAVVDVKTPDGGGSYNPNAANAPVTIYATGVRNGYDFVWHSNGHLYMPANGSAAGGDTPAGPGNSPPAMFNVQQTMHDYVFDIVPGGYYGQPNPTRGEYILNGGNPTSKTDRNQVIDYPVGTQPDPNYRFDVLDLQQNYAPTGVIEYKSNRFGGALKGRMLLTRYSGGDDIFILTVNPDGTLKGINGVGMDGFNDPTDIIEDPRNGNIYVAQLGTDKSSGGKRITLLRPVEKPILTKLQLINADAGYSLGALRAKGTFNLADLPTRNLSIKALFANATASVKFEIDGQVQIENAAPFALKGNNPDNSYIPWTPTVGMHELKVTGYSGTGATGTASPTATLVFWVIDQARPFNAFINFQPVDTPSVKGYKSDWGRLYALRGNGLTYGWNKATYNFAYDRNNPISPDQRFDTGITPGGRKWEIAVPNGTYSVFLLGGDPNDPVGTYNVGVENVPTLVGQTNAQSPWIGKTVQVTVSDNTLTVAPLPGSVNHKISFIQIVST